MLRWGWAACGLALALAGCGNSYDERVYGLPEAQAKQLCEQTKKAIEQMGKEYEDMNFPTEEAKRQVAENCHPQYVVPSSGVAPAVSAKGCAPAYDDAPPIRINRRALARPRGSQAPFAPRAGKLPGNGPAMVGGVDLPAGSRCGNHWATDAATPAAVSLARRLAAAFPQTGVWPVLWTEADDPDSYMGAGGDPAQADGLDVHDVLQEVWNGPLPPLARGSKGTPPADPFGILGRHFAADPDRGDAAVLILVPVNRPADVASVLGVIASEVITDAQATAVLRSWEDRFGAVVTEIAPGGLGVSVGAPPTTKEQAFALAHEHMAFTPDDASPNELPSVAARLMSGSGAGGDYASREYWAFGWPD